MARFETSVAIGAEADRFLTTLFFFLQSSGRSAACVLSICSEPDGDHERKTVTFFEEQEAAEFNRFWMDVNKTFPQPGYGH